MKRNAQQPQATAGAASQPLLRWGGYAALAAGVLFLAWGYLDRSGIQGIAKTAVDVLSVLVPALFAVGLAGLHTWGPRDRPARAGMILGLTGTAWGTLKGISSAVFERTSSEVSGWLWSHHLRFDWLDLVWSGMLILGISMFRDGKLRGKLALPFAMGAVGWAYALTDLGSMFEARAIHVVAALLIAVGWTALGITLLSGTRGTTGGG